MEKNNALETRTFLSSYRLQRDSLCSDTHTAVDFGNIVTRGVYCNSASFIGTIMSHLCVLIGLCNLTKFIFNLNDDF